MDSGGVASDVQIEEEDSRGNEFLIRRRAVDSRHWAPSANVAPGTPGTPATLERTADGGRTFVAVRHLPFDGACQTQFVFVDQQHGYALGWESRPEDVQAGHAAVLFTADGGQGWDAVLGGTAK